MSVLKKYYRKPNLFITLPSGLHFYSNEMFSEDDLSSMKEVGILPMTTMNELMLKNPEALLNGSAIEELIKDSTTLKNTNVKHLVKSDIDALLVGIRIASQGDIEELELNCPKCDHEATYHRDLKSILGNIKPHDNEYTVVPKNMDGLVVYLRPSTFQDNLILESHAFDEQKKISEIRKNISQLTSEKEIEEDDEIKFMSSIHEIFKELTINTMEIYTQCIEKIVIGDEVEYDKDEIHEWLKQIDSDTFGKIRDKLSEINDLGLGKFEEITCVECEHVWNQPLDTNPTDFFGTGS